MSYQTNQTMSDDVFLLNKTGNKIDIIDLQIADCNKQTIACGMNTEGPAGGLTDAIVCYGIMIAKFNLGI